MKIMPNNRLAPFWEILDLPLFYKYVEVQS